MRYQPASKDAVVDAGSRRRPLWGRTVSSVIEALLDEAGPAGVPLAVMS